MDLRFQFNLPVGSQSYEVVWWSDDIVVGNTTTVENGIMLSLLVPGNQYTIGVESVGENGYIYHQDNVVTVATSK